MTLNVSPNPPGRPKDMLDQSIYLMIVLEVLLRRAGTSKGDRCNVQYKGKRWKFHLDGQSIPAETAIPSEPSESDSSSGWLFLLTTLDHHVQLCP